MKKQRIKIFKTNILNRINRRPCKISYFDNQYYILSFTTIIYL